MANTSSIRRSKRCDHAWYPPDTFTSCAVMRRRSPAFRTLPSGMVFTRNSWPILRTSDGFPLNSKAELRDTTRVARHLAEVGDEFLRESVGEVFVLFVAAEIDERQHEDGDAAAGGR